MSKNERRRKVLAERRAKRQAYERRKLARQKQQAEIAVQRRSFREYINALLSVTLSVDETLFQRIGERLDVMDGMGALAEIYSRLEEAVGPPVANPAQQEYHFRSHEQPNPLDGITVHFLDLDGKVYVSDRQFCDY